MDIVATGFRIKQAIGLTGYNVKDFCERTHRSRVTTALWIAGRGGAIKEANMEELCVDLLSCNVVCDKDWLYSGKGPSPVLHDHDRPDSSTLDEKSFLQYFEKNMFTFTKKHKGDQIIECNTKQYYSVSIKENLEKIKVQTNNYFSINLKKNSSHLCKLIADCSESGHLVIHDFDDKIKCIPKESIHSIGKVLIYILKH